MTEGPVKRYDCYCDFDYSLLVEECETGDFVLHADHAARIEALEAENARLAQAGPIFPILLDAVEAAEKAMKKFPQPNYVISKWAEETGEVTKALIHAAEGRETWENVRGEIVQSLAMLHRLMIEGDQVHGLPPLSSMAAPKDSEQNKTGDDND